MKKTAATSIILTCFRAIPLFVRRRLFKGLFLLFYHLSSKHRLITLYNLRHAFPEKDLVQIVRIAKGAFMHIGIVLAEFFEIPGITDENIHQRVEFEGMENYTAAIAQQKGIIASIAHFGNWELFAAAFSFVVRHGAEMLTKAGIPTEPQRAYVIYRPLDNPTIENLTTWVRTLNGIILVPKGGTGQKSLSLIQQKDIVAIASDQNVSAREGIFIDFFGRPACTAVGLAALALRTGAPIISAFMARAADGKYRLVVQPPLEFKLTGNEEQDLRMIMQQVTASIENYVRQYPEQYFWMHQRWKTKPWQA